MPNAASAARKDTLRRNVGKPRRRAKAKAKTKEMRERENPKAGAEEEEARARARTAPKEDAICAKGITLQVIAPKREKAMQAQYTPYALSR